MGSLYNGFLDDEQGQDLVEYSLILGFILFTVLGLAAGFKSSIAGITSLTNTHLSMANSSAIPST